MTVLQDWGTRRETVKEEIQLLFVDDEEEFVDYMSRRLKPREIDVHAYTDPVRALKETAKQNFDVALLDLRMPKMDGEELLNRLKERDPTIEIIILTGHGSASSAFRSAQSGAFEYLLKPCEFVDLVSSINKAYAKRIKAVDQERSRQVDELMQHAGEIQPLTMLNRLKKIRDGETTHGVIGGPAEGHDSSEVAVSPDQEDEK
jgi:DNA-binding NtrC family response regulator